MNNQYILPINIIINPPDVIKSDVEDKVKNVIKADYSVKQITKGINAFRFSSFYKEEGQEDIIKTDSTFLFWDSIAYEREWIVFDNLQEQEQRKDKYRFVDNEKIEKVIDTIFRIIILKNISVKHQNLFNAENKYMLSLESRKKKGEVCNFVKQKYSLSVEENNVVYLKLKNANALEAENKQYRMFELLRTNKAKIIKKPTLTHTTNIYYSDMYFSYRKNKNIDKIKNLKAVVQKNNITLLSRFSNKTNLNYFYSPKFVKIQTDFNLKPYYSKFLIMKEIE